MFWNTKPKFKLPDTAAELNYRNAFLRNLLPKVFSEHIDVFSFAHDYPSEMTKEDALAIFETVKTHMGLKDVPLHLEFFWEKPLETKEHTGFIDTAELYKRERLTIGQYLDKDTGFTIKLGMTTLKKRETLVFVLAHELAHYILLGQHQLFFNDEKLTDMLAIAYGFGANWLHSQHWVDYKSEELTSYLTRAEGLFVLGRFIDLNSPKIPWENLPKKSASLLKKAIDSAPEYSEKELPYTPKFIKVGFIQAILKLKISQPYSYDNLSAILKTIDTYNIWVKKGQAKTLKKKRPETEKIVYNFIQGQKKWIASEIAFIDNAMEQVHTLLDSDSSNALEKLIQSLKKHLANCDSEVDNRVLIYQEHSSVNSAAILQISSDYRRKKARDIHAYLKTELDESEYNVMLDI